MILVGCPLEIMVEERLALAPKAAIFCHLFAGTETYLVSSLMGLQMNARQQCHISALGNTLGEGITIDILRDHPSSS